MLSFDRKKVRNVPCKGTEKQKSKSQPCHVFGSASKNIVNDSGLSLGNKQRLECNLLPSE
jgi:hypothetical protein